MFVIIYEAAPTRPKFALRVAYIAPIDIVSMHHCRLGFFWSCLSNESLVSIPTQAIPLLLTQVDFLIRCTVDWLCSIKIGLQINPPSC